MKTEIYNLIILDESGSMRHMKSQTIGGCNETIDTIKALQRENMEKQTHYISIFVFQSSGPRPSRYLIKNMPAMDVPHIKDDDYEAWGSTPLLDAIGSTLVDLKATTSAKDFALGSVTIITDGYENSSTSYTYEKVARMISALKEIGWNFTFFGANIDVDKVADTLNIDNKAAFTQDVKGTQEMFARQNAFRKNMSNSMNDVMKEEYGDQWEQELASSAEISEEKKRSIFARLKKRAQENFQATNPNMRKPDYDRSNHNNAPLNDSDWRNGKR